MIRAPLGALALALGTAAAYGAPALAAIPTFRFPGVSCRHRSPGLALTFDDGPVPDGTTAVLEALAAAGASATFYVVGEQVERAPAVLAAVVAAGHAVGLHGHRHRPHALMTPRAVNADLSRGLAVVEDAIGTGVRSLRAPYGAASLATLRFAAEHGLAVAGWSRWARDWEHGATPTLVCDRLLNGARDGDVLLLHDADTYSAPGSWRVTAAAIPLVVAAATTRGLTFAAPAAPSSA